jgi:Tat protein secretion system quality control protein TatD with DNase activity
MGKKLPGVLALAEGHSQFYASVGVHPDYPDLPSVSEDDLVERAIYFGTISKGREISKELIITIAPDKSFKLISAACTGGDMAARLEPVAEGNGKTGRG